MSDLSRVILSMPTLLSEVPKAEGKKSPRSWIQLARTGSFVSSRYGKFDITKADLTQMLHNWKEVTPKAPTQLPIDFDHLSMDPKKPMDGAAAGWIENLQLRGDEDELWGEVSWTPRAADAIENKEYRFVSPSFVKNHTHKNGEKIGTTLLAAAITNHPFLEKMAALSLYSFRDVPLYNFSDTETLLVSAHEALHLVDDGTKAGQRVMIAPGNARTQDEIGATFEIAEVVGDGDDAFVSVKDANGMIHKWFRATELLPASSTPANPQHPGLVPGAAPTVPAQAGTAAMPGQPGVPPAALPAAGAVPVPVGPAGLPGAGGAVPGMPNTGAVVNPNAPGVPPSDPAAPNPAAIPNPLATAAGAKAAGAEAKDGTPGDKAAAASSDEGGTGGDGKKTAVAVSPKPGTVGATAAPGSLQDLQLPDELKKAIAAALAAANPQQKGMNMKFQLNDDKGQPIEISAEQLEAAGVKIVKDGETVIAKSALSDLQGTVTSLSSRLDQSEKDKAANEMAIELNRLSQGAFITKPERDWAEKTWKDAKDLSGFNEWAATKTSPVVSLNREHGSGGKPEVKTNAVEATEKLVNLSQKIAKDEGISLRDATIKAGSQLATEADAYREQFADA